MKNTFVIYDLEFTSWNGAHERDWSGKNEHREVVQIGAIRVEKETLTEVEAFDVFVKPKLNPILSDYLINLTHITQEQIDTQGLEFPEASNQFVNWVGEQHIYSWGDDMEPYAETCDIQGIPVPFPSERVHNLNDTFIQLGREDALKYNSGRLTEAFGKPSPYNEHNALDDVRTILLALHELPGVAKEFESVNHEIETTSFRPGSRNPGYGLL